MTRLQIANLNISKVGLYSEGYYMAKMSLTEYNDLCQKVKSLTLREISNIEDKGRRIKGDPTQDISEFYAKGYHSLICSLRAVMVFPTSVWLEVFAMNDEIQKCTLQECALLTALEIILGQFVDLGMVDLISEFLEAGVPQDHPLHMTLVDFDKSVKLAKKASDTIKTMQREVQDFIEFIANQSNIPQKSVVHSVLSDINHNPRKFVESIERLNGDSEIAYASNYGFTRNFSKYLTNLNHNMRNDSYSVGQTELLLRLLKELIFVQGYDGLCKNLYQKDSHKRLYSLYEISKGNFSMNNKELGLYF